VQVDELAAEFGSLGRLGFVAKYGRHFLVFTDASLADDVSSFVNTASRDVSELLSGKKHEKLDVRPLKSKQKGAEQVTLGRSRSCDIMLRHTRVSSLHAHFSEGGGLLFITDEGSKNGTRVNKVKAEPRRPLPVDVGDTIAFGPVTATLWGIEDLIAAIG
jgi:pSer/pThr/pTyr-binding forkhead associated (FHA) protein